VILRILLRVTLLQIQKPQQLFQELTFQCLVILFSNSSLFEKIFNSGLEDRPRIVGELSLFGNTCKYKVIYTPNISNKINITATVVAQSGNFLYNLK
jgi:hypothetical protein